MKRRVLLNKPDIGRKGQYVFFDDSEMTYLGSNSVPQPADKFADRDLYTVTSGDEINNHIVNYGLAYPGQSFIKIDRLQINNVGTGRRHKSCHFVGWIFDNFSYGDGSGNDDPTKDSYNEFFSKLPQGASRGPARFFDWGVGNLGRGGSPETALEKVNIAEDLGSDIEITQPDFERSYADFDIARALNHNGTDNEHLGVGETRVLIPNAFQTVYFVIYCQGDDRRGKSFWKFTDRRRKRLHIFKINVDDLFNADGSGKETSFIFEYADAVKKEGGGGGWGAETPAFMVNNFDITINTIPSSTSNLSDSISWVTGSILTPKLLELEPADFDNSFLTQHPYNAISNLKSDPTQDPILGIGDYYYNNYPDDLGYTKRQEVRYDFEPVAKVNLLYQNANITKEYTYQAYQTSSLDRQVCSAPGEISLDFDISEKPIYDFSELNNNANYTGSLGYKFYVVNWNDRENKFNKMEDYLNDIPENFFEILTKREDNLYNFNNIGNPLKHNYKKSGLKTIKSVLFSHTLEGTIQIVRWKFIKTRIFLDIPVSKYPDFGQVGGAEYATLPWPYTAPIIGGIHKDSKYKTSIEEILGGGRIDDSDVVDEQFLVAAYDNDEQGESINKFDLEQVRYFTTGSYDMHTLLGINPVQEVEGETNVTQNYNLYECYHPGAPPHDIPTFGEGYLGTIAFGTTNGSCSEPVISNIVGQEDTENLTIIWTGGSSALPEHCCLQNFGAFGYPGPFPMGMEVVETDEWPSNMILISSFYPYTDNDDEDGYWNCSDWKEQRTKCFSDETSVGDIFIDDNLHSEVKSNCKLELNVGNIDNGAILDSSGNSNKGILIGDYKIKKIRKGQKMKRDSYVKLPKKTNNSNGAL
tara:strand:- start:15714 stop:18311 length:2598 start_codon:yes stop_codon:yes gene_type:complete